MAELGKLEDVQPKLGLLGLVQLLPAPAKQLSGFGLGEPSPQPCLPQFVNQTPVSLVVD